MVSLIFSCIYFEITISFANSLRIHYFFAKGVSIHHLLRESTMNSLYLSRIHNLFREFTRDSVFFRKFTLNLLSLSRIHYLFREFTRDSLFFCEFTLNLLSLSRIHYDSINFSHIDPEFTISFANSLWIN